MQTRHFLCFHRGRAASLSPAGWIASQSVNLVAQSLTGLAFVLALSLSAACGSEDPPPKASPSLDLVTITDIDPAPDVVEVNLVAAVGQTKYLEEGPTDIWGYKDGSKADAVPIVPGPVIEANQGDRVVVHFKNELPEGTTIHWHGIRVPNGSDGTHVTQHEVHPGGTFDYEFTAHDAGTFWFHPHVRADKQIERGLYAILIVRGGPDIPVDADRMFILDDVKLEANGRLSEVTDATDMMIGRTGNVLLANGRSGGKIKVKNGARERWRFVNSANGRYFSLRLRGHTFNVIGWDGGVLPEPYRVETILIAPGERYEVLMDLAGAEGESISLETLYYFRAHGMPYVDPAPVFSLEFAGQAPTPEPLPTTWGTVPDITVDANTRVQNLVLTEDDEHLPEGQEPHFYINGKAYPDVPLIEGTSDDIEIWAVTNDGEMDHPFHLHGMFFKVLDFNGDPPAHTGWKDTVNVKHPGTLRFAVRYGGPGRWMYHCHILEHAEGGMMGELLLSPKR